jgi:hypothetical protein
MHENVVEVDSSLATTAGDAAAGIRFLIFRPPLEAAQGIGNLMNGLLATHLLGMEFNRVVCVSPEWHDFFVAFDVLDPKCANIPSRTLQTSLWLVNFGKLPVNECHLRDKLASKRDPVLYLVANTYPSRWPTTGVPLLKLESYYTPRVRLLKSLPWKSSPPSTVVHLRQPDDPGLDPREGLDTATLQALGSFLSSRPSTPFLVTNQVDFYDYFQFHFGWYHPSWQGVQHSANAKVEWGDHGGGGGQQKSNQHEQQILELWSDWWTLYQAEAVYHTHSDFSLSAVHWSSGNTKESYTIRGIDSLGALRLEADQQRPLQPILPLSQRTEVQHCQLYPSGLDGLGYVMDLDDEYHDDLQDDS